MKYVRDFDRNGWFETSHDPLKSRFCVFLLCCMMNLVEIGLVSGEFCTKITWVDEVVLFKMQDVCLRLRSWMKQGVSILKKEMVYSGTNWLTTQLKLTLSAIIWLIADSFSWNLSFRFCVVIVMFYCHIHLMSNFWSIHSHTKRFYVHTFDIVNTPFSYGRGLIVC